MLENSERSVRGVRIGKSGPLERAELANQIQGFRIPDRWDASKKIRVLIEGRYGRVGWCLGTLAWVFINRKQKGDMDE